MQLSRNSGYVIAGAALLVVTFTAAAFTQYTRGSHASDDSVDGPWQPEQIVTHRSFVGERWDTLWVAPQRLALTARPFTPRFVATSGGSVHVFDDRARTVVTFDRAGEARGTLDDYLRKTGFLKAGVDIKGGGGGTLFVLDPRNARLIVVGPDGQAIKSVALPQRPLLAQLAPLPNGEFITYDLLGTDFVIRDMNAAVIKRIRAPWRAYAGLNQMLRQGLLASTARGEWIFAMNFGDAWFAFQDTSSSGQVRKYAQYHALPRVTISKRSNSVDVSLPEDTPCTACAVVGSDTSWFVLSGGVKPHLGTLIDEFDVASGVYRHSYALPMASASFAVTGDTFYVVTLAEPRRLLALRPQARARLNPHPAK